MAENLNTNTAQNNSSNLFGNGMAATEKIYQITYRNLMGTSHPNPGTYTSSTPNIQLQSPSVLSGYLFAGWYDAEQGGNRVTTIPKGSSGDITLYARWEQIPAKTHTLTYYANDAGGPPAQNIPAPVTVNDGDTVTLSTVSPTREGYTFTGWNTMPNGTGTTYLPGADIHDVTSDINLYAQWIANPPAYTITYYGNSDCCNPAQSIPDPVQVTGGDPAVVSQTIPVRECYCFVGWNTSPCGRGTQYCPGQTIANVQDNLNLYAQWKRMHHCRQCCYCGYCPNPCRD